MIYYIPVHHIGIQVSRARGMLKIAETQPLNFSTLSHQRRKEAKNAKFDPCYVTFYVSE